MSSKENQKEETDAFLQSMTFARKRDRHFGACDCDECGVTPGGFVLPNEIKEAIDRFKRTKGTLKRTQERQLVRQEAVKIGEETVMFSIWQWTLPSEAEPLLEFGNNHRIICVQRLGRKLQHIGTGIVGSSSEEDGRYTLESWAAGSAHVLASRQGKAVGWVHENDNETMVPAVLYMIKIPPSAIHANMDKSVGWCRMVRNICQRALVLKEQCESSDGAPLEAQEAKQMLELCKSLQDGI
ncbi:hypothetical protein FisN_5Hh301 [Fistulifera solaris]|uniref:Uncharacterized protein n=1 Tax=Fistulifera solaris TaxID=1519565 RepID=A0A1Z5JSC2_FISSO|nr:hypothetical protein FisN_5Hh301 [Fistulifera solaris]|eukprot:GAX16924.1 hypothetical protein FisN_5Hh301 [Fistulifera solaris]